MGNRTKNIGYFLSCYFLVQKIKAKNLNVAFMRKDKIDGGIYNIDTFNEDENYP